MTIWRRSDGSIAIDVEGGPFVVLPAAAWSMLCGKIRRGETPL